MINLDKTKIILASQSPRRCELMKQAGFEFEIIKSEVDEKITKSIPSDIVKELSLQKADDVFNKLMSHIDFSLIAFEDLSFLVIGADTIVTKNGKIMGKPKNFEEAFSMIKSIQDSTHKVYTGVTLIKYDFNTKHKEIHSFFESTDVTLYPMTDLEISSYISTGHCYDKAGGYGIQGQFAVYVKGINGDYNNVVGLPIAHLYHELNLMK